MTFFEETEVSEDVGNTHKVSVDVLRGERDLCGHYTGGSAHIKVTGRCVVTNHLIGDLVELGLQ